MGTLEDLFDPERLRKSWAAEPAESAQPALHPRVADVRPAFDLSGSASELLTRIRATAGLRFPQHRKALEPFFERAQRKIAALESPEEAEEARAALVEIFADVQELLEAWILTDRR